MLRAVRSMLVTLMLGVAACGGTAVDRNRTTASPTSAAGYERLPQQKASTTTGSPPPAVTEPGTQPVQPQDVPTPVEGILGEQWQCSGEIDAARLQSQLDAAASDFQACFVDVMVRDAHHRVEVRLLARVGELGRVTDQLVRSVPTLPDAQRCAESVLRSLQLVRPRGGNCVVLDYPLRFNITSN